MELLPASSWFPTHDGGFSVEASPPRNSASERALLDCALAALGRTDAERDAVDAWSITFRIRSEADTIRLEFSDLRHAAESLVTVSSIPAQECEYGFLVLSFPESAAWSLVAWTLHGEPFAIASGLLDPRCVPSDPEGNYYARFSVLHSGAWSFNGGAGWCRDPDLPLRFLASFNGASTDSLAEAKFMGPKYWGRIFLDGSEAEFERLECVPLAEWERPVWRLQVQAEVRKR